MSEKQVPIPINVIRLNKNNRKNHVGTLDIYLSTYIHFCINSYEKNIKLNSELNSVFCVVHQYPLRLVFSFEK